MSDHLTWYLQQVLQGKPLPETFSVIDPETGRTTRAMVGGPPPGYGAKAQIQHADRVREFITNDYDPVKNPKLDLLSHEPETATRCRCRCADA